MNSLIYFVLFLAGVSAESCITCSSANNALCATKPGSLMARSCPVQNSTCFTSINFGVTSRGCTSNLNMTELSTCMLNSTCQTCNQTGCNNQIFPPGRPTCYQCNSGSDMNCTQTSYSLPLPCQTYKEDDRCFIFKSNNVFVRGCLTSSSGLCGNISQCYVCNGHGCNDLPGGSPIIPMGSYASRLANVAVLLICSSIFFLHL